MFVGAFHTSTNFSPWIILSKDRLLYLCPVQSLSDWKLLKSPAIMRTAGVRGSVFIVCRLKKFHILFVSRCRIARIYLWSICCYNALLFLDQKVDAVSCASVGLPYGVLLCSSESANVINYLISLHCDAVHVNFTVYLYVMLWFFYCNLVSTRWQR